MARWASARTGGRPSGRGFGLWTGALSTERGWGWFLSWFSTTGQIDLDAPKANPVGGVGRGIDTLEHPPAPSLSFQDN